MTQKPLEDDFETFIDADINDNQWEQLDTSPGDRIKWDRPKTVEAFYEGGEEGRSQAGYLLHHVKENGVPKTFYGTVQLDAALRGANVGDTVRIQYLGELKLPGGKTLKQFNVHAKRAKPKK